MACTPCAQKRARQKKKFRWTDGENVVDYDSELQAKAKVSRRGGSYDPIEKT